MGIESHVGVVGEKERAAGTDPNVELDSEIGVAVGVVIAVGDAAQPRR